MEKADPVISACGDDCAVCPRYLAGTEEERRETAEFWFRAGWRGRIVTDEEIRCRGCGTKEQCSYMLLPCVKAHGVAVCRDCPEFECEKVRDVWESSRRKMQQCRNACETEEEFRMLCRAFYEKERNMGGKSNA